MAQRLEVEIVGDPGVLVQEIAQALEGEQGEKQILLLGRTAESDQQLADVLGVGGQVGTVVADANAAVARGVAQLVTQAFLFRIV